MVLFNLFLFVFLYFCLGIIKMKMHKYSGFSSIHFDNCIHPHNHHPKSHIFLQSSDCSLCLFAINPKPHPTCMINFTSFWMSYKWNYLLCTLMWLTPFAYYDNFGIYLNYCVSYSLLFLITINQLNKYTVICLSVLLGGQSGCVWFGAIKSHFLYKSFVDTYFHFFFFFF